MELRYLYDLPVVLQLGSRCANEELTHPHPAPCLVALLAALGGRLKIDGSFSMAEFAESSGVAIRRARGVWSRLGLPLDRFQPFSDMDAVRGAAENLIDQYKSHMAPRRCRPCSLRGYRAFGAKINTHRNLANKVGTGSPVRIRQLVGP